VHVKRSSRLQSLTPPERLLIHILVIYLTVRRPLALTIALAALARLFYSILPNHPLAAILSIGISSILLTFAVILHSRILLPFREGVRG